MSDVPTTEEAPRDEPDDVQSDVQPDEGNVDDNEWTPLAGDELVDALYNERSSVNPRTDSASQARYDTLTWVISLVEDPEDREATEVGEPDEAQEQRDREHAAAEQGVEPDALDEDQPEAAPEEDVASAPDQEPPPDETEPAPFT